MTLQVRSFDHRLFWLLAGIAIVAIVATLNATFSAMMMIWLESDSFNHCFLIPPTSAYLIWRRRKQLAVIEPVASLAGLAAVGIAVGVWVLGDLANTVIVRNFAAVAFIPLSVWAILGSRVVREIMFPLGYLFFMVPVGHFLIPLLMDYTADFTVAAVRASGVAVYRDGLFFMIPGGSFKIVEACSGIRMLIASLAVSTLIAYLEFDSRLRRLFFVAGFACIAILANGIRAYTVVMTGHYIGMETIADHVLLGYLMFAVVIALMLLVGSRFSDRGMHDVRPVAGRRGELGATSGPGKSVVFAAVIIAVVAVMPFYAATVKNRSAGAPVTPFLTLPEASSEWSGPETAELAWAPKFVGYTSAQLGRYRRNALIVDVYVILYLSQAEGAELISDQNRMFDYHRWTLIRNATGFARTAAGKSVEYREIEIRSKAGAKRLVRHWYVVDDRPQLNPFIIKLRELQNTLLGRSTSAGIFLVSTRFSADIVSARRTLDDFMAEALR